MFCYSLPGAGLEPAWDCSQEILSLSRIPIPPPGLLFFYFYFNLNAPKRQFLTLATFNSINHYLLIDHCYLFY